MRDRKEDESDDTESSFCVVRDTNKNLFTEPPNTLLMCTNEMLAIHQTILQLSSLAMHKQIRKPRRDIKDIGCWVRLEVIEVPSTLVPFGVFALT